jgi:hypothetical protein
MITGLRVDGEFKVIDEGFFTLENTSNHEILLDSEITIGTIGRTFLFTVTLYANSSSAVHISFYGYPNNWFEGEKEFNVYPNQTRSEIYVSHGVSDDTPYLGFEYYLVEPEKNASGTFEVLETHPGYPVDVGTSHIYVENITMWIEAQSSESMSNFTSTTDTATDSLSILGFFIGSSFIIIYRKQRKL